MRTQLTVLFFLALCCTTEMARATDSATPLRPAAPEVTARFYGRTLSGLGRIVAVHVELPSERAAVQKLIDQSKLRDYRSTGVAGGLNPRFRIDYADGLRVHADKYTARVLFPNGTSASYVLLP